MQVTAQLARDVGLLRQQMLGLIKGMMLVQKQVSILNGIIKENGAEAAAGPEPEPPTEPSRQPLSVPSPEAP